MCLVAPIYQWVIDSLTEEDVVVADMYDKIYKGTFLGGNLATAIKTRTKTGVTSFPRQPLHIHYAFLKRGKNMSFDEICRERCSVRSFSSEVIGRDDVLAILRCMTQAPTALNHQPYEVIVAQGEEAIERLERAGATLYGARTVLVLLSDGTKGWRNRYSDTDETLIDIGIVTATALYAAKGRGIDSCCVCNFDPCALREQFRLPPHLTPETLILLGRGSEDAVPSERHFSRRDPRDFTHWV